MSNAFIKFDMASLQV